MVSNLSGDEHINDISLVDIDSNNGDDFNTEFIWKLNSDSLNEIVNSLLNDNREVLHSILATTVHIIELPDCLFSPYDLCAKERNLSTVVLEPNVSFLEAFSKIPVVSSCFGNFYNISQSSLHHSFEITEIIFDGTLANESITKFDIFTFIGNHTFDFSCRVFVIISLDEFKGLQSIEAITNVLVDLLWILTI